jgi:hypothetical protein
VLYKSLKLLTVYEETRSKRIVGSLAIRIANTVTHIICVNRLQRNFGVRLRFVFQIYTATFALQEKQFVLLSSQGIVV